MKVTPSQEIISELQRRGCTIFVQLLAAFPRAGDFIDVGHIKTVFIPTDNELTKFLEFSGMSLAEFINSPVGISIFSNHFSYDSWNIKSIHPIGTINGLEVSKTPSSLKMLGLKYVLKFPRTNVVFIKKVLFNHDQLNVLMGIRKQNEETHPLDSNVTVFEKWLALPTDVFYQIVETQELKGKDLISLCLMNYSLNQKCNSRNEELFRRLLLKDYGIVSDNEHRTKYVEWSKTRIWTFGTGFYGELGQGAIKRLDSPTTINGLEGIRQISCGAHFTCVLDSYGQVWISGSVKSGRNLMKAQYMPKILNGFKHIQQISCGRNHVAFLDSHRRVWTFGDGFEGSLGHGDQKNQALPKMIEGFNTATQVICGNNNTFILDILGRIWALGAMLLDDLMNHKFQSTPEMIPGFADVRQLSAGSGHYAFLDSLGQIWTAGANHDGQLGHGNNISLVYPKMIKGFQNLRHVACGGNATFFIDSEGQVWSFGDSDGGRLLGHPDRASYNSPEMIHGFENIRTIFAGPRHTAFIDENGQVWTFGDFEEGQLGYPRMDDGPRIPRLIEGFHGVKQVSCGASHTAFLL
jgi:alpha-tubulin suppressor-like RCC1 family protein